MIPTIIFKEWLPDQPELGNPGLLTADNVRPIDGTYKSFVGNKVPLSTSAAYTIGGFPHTPNGVFLIDNSQVPHLIAGSSTSGGTTNVMYYKSTSGSNWTTAGAFTASPAHDYFTPRFALYGSELFVSGNTLQYGSIATSSITLANVTAGPAVQEMGVIGQFLMVSSGNTVRWPSIDDPHDWQTAGSATAIARQSGTEDMPRQHGDITGISGWDKHGVILQKNAVHRVSYVGGNVVWQFDRIAEEIGCDFPTATVQVGGKVYFVSRYGIYATDGYQIQDIGGGKVNKFFASRVNRGLHYRTSVAVDRTNRLIYWSYPTSTTTTTGALTSVMVYNYDENRWAHGSLNSMGLGHGSLGKFSSYTDPEYLVNFEGSATVAQLSSSATLTASAVLVTGDVEPNPGGYFRAGGIKPLVDVTAGACLVSLGVRNDLQTASSFGSAVTATAATGFADLNKESRYQRVKFTITGTFNAAQGFEAEGWPTGRK